MVAEGLLRTVIYPETFGLAVIVRILLAAFPVMAFDAEMVVALGGEFGLAVTGLEQALGKGNAGRNAAALHFADGDGGVGVNISALRRVR